MSDTAVHFSNPDAAEQGVKGFKTGFDATDLFVFLEERASAWKEYANLNVQLLRALCQLSIDDPLKARTGFTSPELVDAISKIRGRPWSDAKDKERMSDGRRVATQFRCKPNGSMPATIATVRSVRFQLAIATGISSNRVV